jgi:hypothetical protein
MGSESLGVSQRGDLDEKLPGATKSRQRGSGTRRGKYQPSMVKIVKTADITNASASFENSVTNMMFL